MNPSSCLSASAIKTCFCFSSESSGVHLSTASIDLSRTGVLLAMVGLLEDLGSVLSEGPDVGMDFKTRFSCGFTVALDLGVGTCFVDVDNLAAPVVFVPGVGSRSAIGSPQASKIIITPIPVASIFIRIKNSG